MPRQDQRGRGTTPFGQVAYSATCTVATGTNSLITWGGAVNDKYAMWDGGSQLLAPKGWDGHYYCLVYWPWSAHADSSRRLILLYYAGFINFAQNAIPNINSGGTGTPMSCPGLVTAAGGIGVSAFVRQDSGVGVTNSTTGLFTMVYLNA